MKKLPDDTYAEVVDLRRLAAEYEQMGREADALLEKAAALRRIADRLEKSSGKGARDA